MGYYGVFLGMQYRNTLSMVRILDAHQYDDAQTVTIKIPVAIPYMTDNAEFQRVDGRFDYQGVHYRLVKQKYAGDTLFVVCVRDHENERISQALSKYVKTFTDNGSDQQKHTKITLSFIKDYVGQSFCLSTLTAGWQIDIARYALDSNLIPTFTPAVVHPPERA
jgi:hypothetical protein